METEISGGGEEYNGESARFVGLVAGRVVTGNADFCWLRFCSWLFAYFVVIWILISPWVSNSRVDFQRF